MSLVKRDSFGELAGLSKEMDRFWNRFFEPWSFGEDMIQAPSIDLAETDSAVVVKADLPGLTDKDIEVTVTDDMLTIKGEKKSEKEEKGKHFHRIERRSGSFQRSVALPAPVNSEKAVAKFENGVLEIKLQKAEEARAKKIADN